MPLSKIQKQSAELVILSVLAEGQQYGYAISKIVSSRSDGAMSLGPSSLYPLLRKLETDGLVQTEWETIRSDRTDDPESPGRRRKWYRLSAKGRKRLDQKVKLHREYTRVMNAFIGGAEGAGA